jgi:hypothetical protein
MYGRRTGPLAREATVPVRQPHTPDEVEAMARVTADVGEVQAPYRPLPGPQDTNRLETIGVLEPARVDDVLRAEATVSASHHFRARLAVIAVRCPDDVITRQLVATSSGRPDVDNDRTAGLGGRCR